MGGIAGLVCASGAQAGPLRPRASEQAEAGLRDLAARRGIVYGAAVSTYQLRTAGFDSVFAREAAILVAEDEMKRGAVEARQGEFDFSAGEELIAFARNRDIAVRGHTLLWHARNPDWLEDAVLTSRDPSLFTNYIATILSRFRGRVRSWDVVNEAILPSDGRADCLRNSFWLKAYGPRYIDEAYHAARAADPAAQLVYNDWGFEAGEPENDRFRAATLAFLEAALARKVPIDALGVQGHLTAFGPQVNQQKLRAFLDSVKALGLAILVTEHDVNDSGGPSRIDERDRAVADASRRFLDVVLDNSATTVVLTWGLSDRFIWTPGWGWKQQLAGYVPRMLPLAADFSRKPMWHAIATSLSTS
jgi:endo-1,4-beta-xylanase